ncbi:MAG TPA: hypothetical protein VLB51_08925 [Methylomirabilota bacterium]|nr:hypothetical protein [Methylomirabilota bacterium]
MSRIEQLDAKNLDDFLAADAAVLMLAKTTCRNCASWTAELDAACAAGDFFPTVRFGKLYLDVPGLVKFKKANPWLAGIEDLPYNIIYVKGGATKQWAGGGLDRLQNRLRRVLGG